ncbi:MAG TPA: hypothetical protein VIK60_01255 [Vicinamibacterales bacterium]
MTGRLARWAIVTTATILSLAPLSAGVQGGGGQAVSRTLDGRPDLSGVWQVINGAAWNIQDQNAAPGPHGAPWLGIPASRGVVEGNEIPYQPWARAKKDENYKNRLTLDPEVNCYLPGVPRITYMPFPFQIVQTPTYIAILYEYVHAIRHIYVDGSTHPAGPIEWWMGDSRGRWEGDTLVVSVRHFNADTWFDRAGNFHSEEMQLTERYSFVDRDTINYEVTVEDSKVFTRPWKMSMLLYRRKEPNVQLLEHPCYSFDGVAVGTRPNDKIAPGR